MKMKSVAGLVLYVKDIRKTSAFYETLGFTIRKQKPDHMTAYLNKFWLDFILISKEKKDEFVKEANMPHKGGGLYIYINVDNVDDYYSDLVSKGLNPTSAPRDWPWGNREFVYRDPDGYKLVFFQKLSSGN